MDFRLGDRSDAFRAEARKFLDDVYTEEMRERMHATGIHHDWDFHRAQVERGWLAPAWPVEYGGQGRDAMEMVAFSEEFQRAGAPTYGAGTTLMIANVIQRLGTEEQKREILPRALKGEIIIVLGFTEPECGSDVAAAQTRAVRDGGEWVINGQKMFTTNAQDADYAFMLTRTNPDVEKHQGLTTFLVPMREGGVEVQPVFTLSGERTNVTFYSDVRVPDSLRVGEVDGGWQVMTVGLTFERSGAQGGESIRALDAMEHWANTSVDDDGRPRLGGSGGAGAPRACRRRKRGERALEPALRVDGAFRGPAGGGGLDGEVVRLGGDHRASPATSWTCSVPTGSGARATRRPWRAGRPSTPSGSPSGPPPTAAPARCSATSSPSADSGCPGPADASGGPGSHDRAERPQITPSAR